MKHSKLVLVLFFIITLGCEGTHNTVEADGLNDLRNNFKNPASNSGVNCWWWWLNAQQSFIANEIARGGLIIGGGAQLPYDQGVAEATAASMTSS